MKRIKCLKKKLRYHTKENENGCWEWQRSKITGYGRIKVEGKDLLTHRASWMAFNGKIQDGLQINHKCHNRACINPEHLYQGTQKDNMRDMKEANRGNYFKGSQCPGSKLVEKQVKTIKLLLNRGFKGVDLAMRFNVGNTTISDIKNGYKWRHVT